MTSLAIDNRIFIFKETYLHNRKHYWFRKEFVNLGCNIIKGEIVLITLVILLKDTFKIEIIDNSNKIKQHYDRE